MTFENQPENLETRWYQTVWGVVAIGILMLVMVGAIYFAFLFFKYWNGIKSGNAEYLFSEAYGGFSSAATSNSTALITRAELETSDDPFLGNPDAPNVIVEFVDFKCPNCRTASPILRQVLSKYGTKVKLIIRDFPVESTHPGAGQAAQMVNCAGQQGLYWVAHDWFFNNQDNLVQALSADEIKIVAGNIGLDSAKLSICLRDNSINAEINRDFTDGYKAGVAGTPTFFVNGKKVEGVVPFSVWDKFLSNQ